MARFCQSRAGAITRLPALFSAILLAVATPSAAVAQALFEAPTLVADPGVHTGVIRSAAVNEAGSVAVTGSEDKTVRVWSLYDGALLRTVRMPSGPGAVGKVFAVAMSPAGDLIAVGGWTSGNAGEESIYLFDRSGSVKKRIGGLADVAIKLAFSADARYLAASLGGHTLHVFDSRNEWAETFSDTNYGDEIYGMTFAADGRLATASHDGKVRLYGPDFKMIGVPREMTSGKTPHQIAFSPNENKLAVGYADALVVDILAGDTLQTIGTPNTQGMTGVLPQVAWSRDGRTLFAGTQNVHAWSDAGLGQHRVMPGGNDTLMSLNPLPDGGLLIATADPLIRSFREDGSVSWEKRNRIGDLGKRSGILRVSSDGTIVDFGFEDGAKAQLRFHVREPRLIRDPPDDNATLPPKLDGVPIERRGNQLFLQGQPVVLDVNEKPRGWAISPDGRRVVIGATWSLRARDANNQRLWRRDGPGAVWAVNIAGNGRVLVAGYDDGTIRWHDLDSGEELLALMVLPTEKMEWVAWTPDGFYDTTGGASGVLQWHINHGPDAAGTTIPVSDASKLHRPEFLWLMLQEGGIVRWLREQGKEARPQVPQTTGSGKHPGPRLHLLAIGISEYATTGISLKFADKDAGALFATLMDTQDIGGANGESRGLYAGINATPLTNRSASKKEIFRQLGRIQRSMSTDDTAIIMFAGHGVTIGTMFYLLPYDTDTTDIPATIKSSAISAAELQSEVQPLADRGRVLVLLDACHSGGFISNKSTAPNADLLRGILRSANVTVLTSSKGTQISREDDAWQHGAFTKVFLEALSDPTIGPRGVISMGELISHLHRNLSRLTHGGQELGIASTFDGDMFTFGLKR